MMESKKTDTHIYYGFIPQDLISRFQSVSYESRINASLEVLHLLSMINFSQVQTLEFLSFIRSYVTDQNLSVAQNSEKIVSSIISSLKANPMSNDEKNEFLHILVQISVAQLSDSRRFVCQLGQNIFGELLSLFDPHLATSELVRQASSPLPKLFSEIFRCFTNLLSQGQLNPDVLLQFPYFFDSGLQDPHGNVKQSAVWCINYLQDNFPSQADALVGLLSRESTHIIRKAPSTNPPTAVSSVRKDEIYIARPSNTAGAATPPLKQTFSRTLPISRNQYHRPMLPSSGGSRETFVFASLSRPVSSISTVSSPPPICPNPVPEENPTFSSTYSGRIDLEFPKPSDDNFDPFDVPSYEVQTLPSLDDIPKPKPSRILHMDVIEDKHKSISPKVTNIDAVAIDQALSSEKGSSRDFSSDHYESDREIKRKRSLKFGSPSKDTPLEIESSLRGRKRTKTDNRHISFEKVDDEPQNPQSPPSEENTFGDKVTGENTPIHATGFYNIGDDVEFDSPPKPINSTPKRLIKPHYNKPRPKGTVSAFAINRNKILTITNNNSSSIPSNSPNSFSKSGKLSVKSNAKPSPAKVPQLIEKLRSSEWTDQNDAIMELSEQTDTFMEQINGSLRDLVPSLLECSTSLRSALAKNALNLLQKWIIAPEIIFENVADICAAGLLQLQTSSHHFIADLASISFLSLMDNISPQKAVSILNNEHRRKHGPARAKVAEGIKQIVPKVSDFQPLLRPLAALIKDATPEARKSAKEAVVAIAQRTKNFSSLVKNMGLKDDDQNSLITVAEMV